MFAIRLDSFVFHNLNKNSLGSIVCLMETANTTPFVVFMENAKSKQVNYIRSKLSNETIN